MANKKIFTDESLITFVDETKIYVNTSVNDLSSRVAHIDIEDNSVDIETGLTLSEVDDRVNQLQNTVISVFEELKTLILNGENDSAIAVLDNAILDVSKLL